MDKLNGGDQNANNTTKNQLNSLGYGDDVKLSQLADAPSGTLVMSGDVAEDLVNKGGRPSDTEMVKITNPLGVRLMTFDGTGVKVVHDYRKNEKVNAEACLVVLDEETKKIYQVKATYRTGTVARTAWSKADEAKEKFQDYLTYYKNPLTWEKGDELT